MNVIRKYVGFQHIRKVDLTECHLRQKFRGIDLVRFAMTIMVNIRFPLHIEIIVLMCRITFTHINTTFFSHPSHDFRERMNTKVINTVVRLFFKKFAKMTNERFLYRMSLAALQPTEYGLELDQGQGLSTITRVTVNCHTSATYRL